MSPRDLPGPMASGGRYVYGLSLRAYDQYTVPSGVISIGGHPAFRYGVVRYALRSGSTTTDPTRTNPLRPGSSTAATTTPRSSSSSPTATTGGVPNRGS